MDLVLKVEGKKMNVSEVSRMDKIQMCCCVVLLLLVEVVVDVDGKYEDCWKEEELGVLQSFCIWTRTALARLLIWLIEKVRCRGV